MNRPETGVMQFGDDWPGVFIRGDSAFGYLMALQAPPDDILAKTQLKGLAELLASCNVQYGTPIEQKAILVITTSSI